MAAVGFKWRPRHDKSGWKSINAAQCCCFFRSQNDRFGEIAINTISRGRIIWRLATTNRTTNRIRFFSLISFVNTFPHISNRIRTKTSKHHFSILESRNLCTLSSEKRRTLLWNWRNDSFVLKLFFFKHHRNLKMSWETVSSILTRNKKFPFFLHKFEFLYEQQKTVHHHQERTQQEPTSLLSCRRFVLFVGWALTSGGPPVCLRFRCHWAIFSRSKTNGTQNTAHLCHTEHAAHAVWGPETPAALFARRSLSLARSRIV